MCVACRTLPWSFARMLNIPKNIIYSSSIVKRPLRRSRNTLCKRIPRGIRWPRCWRRIGSNRKRVKPLPNPRQKVFPKIKETNRKNSPFAFSHSGVVLHHQMLQDSQTSQSFLLVRPPIHTALAPRRWEACFHRQRNGILV